MNYPYYAQVKRQKLRAGLEFINTEKNFDLCRAPNPGLTAHDEVSALNELTYILAAHETGHYYVVRSSSKVS